MLIHGPTRVSAHYRGRRLFFNVTYLQINGVCDLQKAVQADNRLSETETGTGLADNLKSRKCLKMYYTHQQHLQIDIRMGTALSEVDVSRG